MTTYDPRCIAVLRHFVDGIWNELPYKHIDWTAPDVWPWVAYGEKEGLMRRVPSSSYALDSSMSIEATELCYLAVKSHDEEQERVVHAVESDAGNAPKAETIGQAAESSGESLKDNEYTVLRALLDARPRRLFMVDLEANTKITRKACGKIIAGLADRGLADYSPHKRAGATITAVGGHLLAVERPLTTR